MCAWRAISFSQGAEWKALISGYIQGIPLSGDATCAAEQSMSCGPPIMPVSSAMIAKGIFVGAEARYFRKYDALGLDCFAGQALFVGPTMFVRFSKTLAVSAAWGIQAAGHAVDVPESLDLTNFTHHQALFRLEYDF